MSRTYKDSEDYDPIDIRESRRGTFTAAAMSHHEGVQEYARHILRDPGEYSEATRRKAQFAVNAKKFSH